MKPSYRDGKLILTAETPDDGFDLAEITQAAKEDGYKLTPRKEGGKLILETHLRQRDPADKRGKDKPANGKPETHEEPAATVEAPGGATP